MAVRLASYLSSNHHVTSRKAIVVALEGELGSPAQIVAPAVGQRLEAPEPEGLVSAVMLPPAVSFEAAALAVAVGRLVAVPGIALVAGASLGIADDSVVVEV